MKPQCRLGIRGPESLESRLTPASVLSYTDVDGDKVTIAASAGVLAGHATIVGGQLRLLDISDPSFDHANLTVSAVRAGVGDGLAAVGRINAGTNDLGAVTVKGDLGVIDAGSNTAGVPAVKSLSVRSMGVYGLATQGGAGDLVSDIRGALGALKVAGDVKGAFVNVLGSAGATLGPVTIGGSLIGGSSDFSGAIQSLGDMGAVRVGRDVRGGSGGGSGLINSRGKVAGVAVGGSLIGGDSNGPSGEIVSSGDMGAVRIGGDVQGGSGGGSGIIGSAGKLAGVAVGGSLIGGSGPDSGANFSGGDMGAVRVGHDMRGGSGFESGFISSSGISSSGELAGVAVGGSLIGGSGPDSGEILSGGELGAVRIGHDVQGGSNLESGFIKSLGKLAGVAVGGSLIGGSGNGSGEIVSVGDMGAVRIGGDLTGASIVAGALDGSGLVESTTGRIASVAVGGSIFAGLDDSAGGGLTDNASIRAAHDIGALTVKGSLGGSVGTGGDVTKVVISAQGRASPTATTDLAIGRISIGGRVERAQILAGYSVSLVPVNGNAQIGAVAVGGDWAASDLIAGVQDTGGDGFFGGPNDAIIPGGTIAKIASVAIRGVVVGTPGGADQFGFESHAIGAFRANGVSIRIASPVALSPITGDDVTIRLV
jgi:hypothetical protein